MSHQNPLGAVMHFVTSSKFEAGWTRPLTFRIYLIWRANQSFMASIRNRLSAGGPMISRA